MTTTTRNEAARVHPISGYEWECGECHYHGLGWSNEGVCYECQRPVTDDNNGALVDSAGVVVDHGELYSAEALAAERRATVERIRRRVDGLEIAQAAFPGVISDLDAVRRFLDEEAAR